jgi:hypothetical protein
VPYTISTCSPCETASSRTKTETQTLARQYASFPQHPLRVVIHYSTQLSRPSDVKSVVVVTLAKPELPIRPTSMGEFGISSFEI